MRIRVPSFGAVQASGNRFAEPLRYLLLAVVIIVVGGGAYLIVKDHNHHNASKTTSNKYEPPITVSDVEAKTKSGTQNFLAQKNYQAYQDVQSNLAYNYLNNGNPDSAERIMNDVFAAVPASKLEYQSYSAMISVQKAKNDTSKVRYYEQALITYLKSQGDTAAATEVQHDLDTLK